MKKLVGMALLVGLCGIAVAGKPNTIAGVQVDNVTTNASAIVTNEAGGSYWGYIDGVILDFTADTAGDASNIDIDIRTKAGEGTGASRTILSIDNFGGDTTYFIQGGSAVNTSGANVYGTNYVVRFPLYKDKIEVLTSDANKTNIAVKAYIIIGQ